MSKNYYRLYVEDTISLSATICIKSIQSVNAINKYISAVYGANSVDLSTPSSWKYYMNICGLYHPTDSMIYIKSLDTLATIPFTKESLADHYDTARAYQYGTRYYTELVSEHPMLEQLIIGVLYPADMTKAIAAEDYTILSYPAKYVEPNEENLIADLQKHINSTRVAWDNPAYGVSDTLYTAASHGIMYLNLIPALMTIRLGYCGTRQAHSFHVREHLASHLGLDIYLNALTLDQSLYLYRNIANIQRNPGSNKQLINLIDKLMTPRNLSMSELTMVHDTGTMPDSFYPGIKFRKKKLNLKTAAEVSLVESLDYLLDKEIPLAVGNQDYLNYESPAIQSSFENTTSSRAQTKVLECSIFTTPQVLGHSLESILFYEWLELSFSGNYNVYIRATNPVTAGDIVLSTKDAFLYALYCAAKVRDFDISLVPDLVSARTQKAIKPTLTELMSKVDANLVDSSVIQSIIAAQPNITNSVSTHGFYLLCQRIQAATVVQDTLIAGTQDFRARAMVERCVEFMYEYKTRSYVTTPTSMNDWLTTKGLIHGTSFTKEQYATLSLDIISKATGIDVTNMDTILNIQSAMVNLLTQLSSYSIQIIKDTSGADIYPIKWPMVRMGSLSHSGSNHMNLDIVQVEPISVTKDIHMTAVDTTETFPIPTSFRVTTNIDLTVGNLTTNEMSLMNNDAQNTNTNFNWYNTPFSLSSGKVIKKQMEVGIFFSMDAPVSTSTTVFPGYEILSTLTPAQLASIQDVYTSPNAGDRRMSLVTAVPVTQLGAFIPLSSQLNSPDLIMDGSYLLVNEEADELGQRAQLAKYPNDPGLTNDQLANILIPKPDGEIVDIQKEYDERFADAVQEDRFRKVYEKPVPGVPDPSDPFLFKTREMTEEELLKRTYPNEDV